MGLVVPGAQAKNLDAGFVLNKMDDKQRYGFVSGVVEGLAYARFLRDRPHEEGMICITDWYYGGGVEVWKKIERWLARHPDKPVGVLLYVLVKKKCGE